MENSNIEIIASVTNALIAAIPIIGSPANSLISDYQTDRKLKRLEELYINLRKEFESDPELVNSEYLKKDDFLDLFEETARNVVVERSQLKRLAFKNILVHSIVKSKVNYDRTEEYLDLLSKLREPHIYILKILIDPVSFDKAQGNVVGNGSVGATSFSQIFKKLLPDWNEEDLLSVLADLESERLTKDIFSGFNNMMTDHGIKQLFDRMTNKGTDFANYCLNSNYE